MTILPLPEKWPHPAKILFTDIDDTLTWEGQLPLETFKALYDLRAAGIRVVPVTGGSAGWADCLIRTWPIDDIITENGSMWLQKDAKNNVTRKYVLADESRQQNWEKLTGLKEEFREVFQTIPDTQDQDFRLTDIAFDIGQQATIPRDLALKAADWWIEKGASARCSSIHINVWIGDYNKAIGASRWLETETSLTEAECVFIGDSPNDEAMFTTFPNTIGVANIQRYLDQLETQPTYITKGNGGYGFVELVECLSKAS